MGKFNSSTTRVVPVFDALFKRDPTAASWLKQLLDLGSSNVAAPENPGRLVPAHERWWGKKERRLQPPLALLEWLVENITPAAIAASDQSEAARKRRLLASGDESTLRDAIRGLRSGKTHRMWYTLEGRSAPDAFVETDQIVLVVEGKRTEASCTTKTTWMTERSQLLRHMDAALEISGDRQVFGLLLVEGDPADPMTPSKFWRDQARSQISDPLVASSLPHRTVTERDRIVSGVLGAATWQRVCSVFGIPWPPAPDVV
jgi:hypothetical protein